MLQTFQCGSKLLSLYISNHWEDIWWLCPPKNVRHNLESLRKMAQIAKIYIIEYQLSIVLKIQLFQNQLQSSQSGLLWSITWSRVIFKPFRPLGGVPGPLKRPQKFQNFPKTDYFIIAQNSIPIHSQWPKMVPNKFLSQC